MGRTKDPLLKRFHRLRKSPEPFHHGMDAEAGREKRATWLDILKELRRVHGFAAGSVRAPGEEEKLLSDVRACIVDAVSYLIEGNGTLEEGDMDDCTTKQLRVWSSPQNARLAIIREAIAVARSQQETPLPYHGKPPVIILISERREESYDEEHETTRRNFLDSWSSTCYGVGEVLTIQAESSEKVRESVEHLFEGFSQSDMFPVLMVIHASQTSNITSDMTSIKRVCESWNVRLCVEGPALAMLAQSNRPSDPDDCASAADVVLLDPASWFGFRLCALVTQHKLVKRPVSREFKDHFCRLLANSSLLNDHDQTHGLATAPVLNLWTVLTRLGLESMRDSIGGATFLAETLINNLRDSPNIVTVYKGIGCVVRISYALSREDRLLPKDKSLEHVSLVNKILFSSLREESEAMYVRQRITSESTCLLFAPARLLASGTLWMPPVDMVDQYSKKLQDTVDKYESCRAGSVAFRSCVAKCREIRFVEDMREEPELHLSFGAFRIVPVEMGEGWEENETSIEAVDALTTLVAREMTESPHEISTPKYVMQEETEEARALAEQFNRNPGRLRSNFLSRAFHRRSSFPHGYGGDGPLPFDVFLHADSDSSFRGFISIEPREKCKPVHAVNQAAVASDLILACVTEIMGLWRAGDITLPLETDGIDESIVDNTEDLDQNNEHMEALVAAEEEALHSQVLEQVPNRPGFHHANVTPGSEVSCATRTSAEEPGGESSQAYGRELQSRKLQNSPSASSGNYEHEAPRSSQIVLPGQAATDVKHAGKKRNYSIGNVLSASTIEKSSRGARTDDETIPSDYILPSAAEGPYQRGSAGVSNSSEPVSTFETRPVVQVANKRSWFGSWRGRDWNNQVGNREDERSSSTSGGESSDGSECDSKNENSSAEEGDEDSQESDSCSSDTASEDHGSADERDETSEDTDRDDNIENEDSFPVGSSSDSTGSSDEQSILSARGTEESRALGQGRASRLLSWMRRRKAQQQCQKSKQKATNPCPNESESETKSTPSQSDLEQVSSHDTQTSEEEEELESFSGELSQTFSSGQLADEDTAEESERGSTTGSEKAHSDAASDGSDGEIEVDQRPRANPVSRPYGLRWFGRAGEPSKPSLKSSRRKNPASDSDLGSSVYTETTSEESSMTDKRSHELSKKSQQGYETRSEGESSERTEITNETGRYSSSDETSDTSDVGRDGRQNETRKRRNTESSSAENSSIGHNDRRSNDQTNSGQSFFYWALPSWATTPPRLGKRAGPIRGVNSRLPVSSSSSESSTETDSDESYERKRRNPEGRKRASAAGGKWSQTNNPSSGRDRYRRRR